jgi:putative chitinase
MAIEIVSQIAPAVSLDSLERFSEFWDHALSRWGILNKSSIGAFISNLAVESAHFKRTLEYASGSEYEGRSDLGNTQPGDGVRFKGRGLIQITGRTAYKQCSLDLFGDQRLLNQPEMLEAPDDALTSACWFWSRYKGINKFCIVTPEDYTHPSGENKFQRIVRMVNGGLNDYAERFANYSRARKILNF